MKISNEKLEVAMANSCMNYKELSEGQSIRFLFSTCRHHSDGFPKGFLHPLRSPSPSRAIFSPHSRKKAGILFGQLK